MHAIISDEFTRTMISGANARWSSVQTLRFGEMERDCMIGHGTSRFLRERLSEVSDAFRVSVCKVCGIMTTSMKECQMCHGNQVVSVNYPYASKLLHQELGAMALKMIIRPSEN